MKFAILAAGKGSRLRAGGLNTPKPLVYVGGERLIDRLLRLFVTNGARDVAVVCNGQTFSYLEQLRAEGMPLYLLNRTTPGPIQSLLALSEWLQGDSFCLTTVDTVFSEEALGSWLQRFDSSLSEGYDGLMGITHYVDDEHPLYVDVDARMNIKGFVDEAIGQGWVSAGVYGLSARCLDTLNRCAAAGETRLRVFQQALLEDGLCLQAYPMGVVADVDRPEDVCTAERLLCADLISPPDRLGGDDGQ